ncbi:MAG: DUF1579 domain-containing protein [Planctomycetota bacterium]|nr:DUF1579 domain-containing protein [Planctomycetota bacterium]
MQVPPPHAHHQWLKSFVGDWTYQAQCVTGPDQPPLKSSGRERVRMVGDFWLVFEGESEMPGGGGPASTLMTLGYDPARDLFVGSWLGSMMTHLYIYEGHLEVSADGKTHTLPLHTTGPDWSDPSKTARYQDVHQLHADGRRLMWAQLINAEGKPTSFMSADYTRVTT